MATRSSSSVLVFVGLAVLLAAVADAQLSESFYARTCPGGVQAVANVVNNAVRNDRRFAAGLLRLHFHDCFVRGCDASVLLNSASRNAEKDAPPNLTLQGFAIIDQAKAALERTCPGVFSCSDILALAARDAVSFIGGPRWRVPLGRRDGSISRAAEANSQLPTTRMGFRALAQNFARKGLSESDMVILSGAHTIGLTHCRDVTPRIYNFAGSRDGADPYLNRTYVTEKRRACPNTRAAAGNFVNLDSSLGGQRFDKNYYENVLNHKAVFNSDDALIAVARGLNQVRSIVRNPQSTFFSQFGAAMEKMGRISVLTGSRGQIRRTCSRTN
ncbi:peroxidase [Marchantia polymorpha subsp. ruderalis]|uniref:Peroxidase n=2 Tax=Marchantia polymorpha TaxID=3197 RepID=A0A176WPC6_MARPO|nr:hypothetical protein AXG93_1054s1620 [Marchantia polymorpha subsp. ruderalis]PTQ41885.1 hypothetical protein MARPO_0032s0074 [Marchantia polymorpha]BBN11671.1 hypothetical protein Mp_5g13840 [Marchantia polymorpha subsp. ruderalis]|eukprot:PTQ41885.1 hypothetical protein MARPO_0032s0074 [Marchantia polymorpha]